MALRKPHKQTVDPEAQADRRRGALLGLAVGDALGSANDGKRTTAPAFPQRMDGLVRDPLGGGPLRLRAGQVSEETQLAICVAMSLREIRKFDPEDMARRYAGWRELKVPTTPTNAAVFDLFKQSRWGWQTAGRDHWLKNGRKPCDNGALVRTAPIGVFFCGDDGARAKASLDDCALTHFDPRCQLACVALNGAIAAAINAVSPTVEDLFTGATTALSIAGALLGPTMKESVREVLEATAMLKEDLALARKPDPQLYGPDLHLNLQSDHVRVTFRLAFWEAANAPSFEAALLDVANRGGDCDGNGAVTGALLGALYGQAQIPERWRSSVLGAPSGTGGDVYHPRNLIPLAETSA